MVFFAPGSAEMGGDGTRHLGALATDYHRQGQYARVTLRARSDTVGSRRANRSLARRRGEAVRDYLAARGIPFGRITIVALGEEELFSPTPDGVPDRLNRMVQAFIEREPDREADAGRVPATC
jgi:OOP family OmpA-OmpF porin